MAVKWRIEVPQMGWRAEAGFELVSVIVLVYVALVPTALWRADRVPKIHLGIRWEERQRTLLECYLESAIEH